MAIGSRSRYGDGNGMWSALTVFQPFGENAKCQYLCAGHGFVTARSISEHARQLWHFGEPTAVVFAIALDIEFHGQPSGSKE